MDNLKGKTVSLAHGAGGKQTSELIDQVFKAHFANPELTSDDAAVLKMKEGKIAFTTDGFIVSPSEFPGGNIGKLSIPVPLLLKRDFQWKNSKQLQPQWKKQQRKPV